MLCCVMLRSVMTCYVMLCYVMLCYVMLCYVMLCYVVSVFTATTEDLRFSLPATFTEETLGRLYRNVTNFTSR
jgi:hypothetical protein